MAVWRSAFRLGGGVAVSSRRCGSTVESGVLSLAGQSLGGAILLALFLELSGSREDVVGDLQVATIDALHSAGHVERALSVLTNAHDRHPNDRQLLIGLATLNRDAGDAPAALEWAKKLLALSPDDAQYRALLEQLQRESP